MISKRLHIIASLALGMACKVAPPAATSAADPSPPSDAGSGVGSYALPSGGPTPALPSAIALPVSVACRLHVNDQTSQMPLITLLRLAPGGPPFARLDPGSRHLPRSLTLPEGEAKAAQLEVRYRGGALRLWTEVADVALYASRAISLQEVFMPDGGAQLRWMGGKPGKLRVALDVPEIDPSRFSDDVACKDLSLDAERFDPAEHLAAQTGRMATIKLPLSLFATSTAAAPQWTLRHSPYLDNMPAPVLEEKHGRLRLLIELATGSLKAWAAAKAVEVFDSGGGGGGKGIGLCGIAAPVVRAAGRVVCRQSVAIVAEKNAQRIAIGYATEVQVVRHLPLWSEVIVPPLRVFEGARLLIRNADIADCRFLGKELGQPFAQRPVDVKPPGGC